MHGDAVGGPQWRNGGETMTQINDGMAMAEDDTDRNTVARSKQRRGARLS